MIFYLQSLLLDILPWADKNIYDKDRSNVPPNLRLCCSVPWRGGFVKATKDGIFGGFLDTPVSL